MARVDPIGFELTPIASTLNVKSNLGGHLDERIPEKILTNPNRYFALLRQCQ